MSTMKAAVAEEFGHNLNVSDSNLPEPGEHQALV